MCPSVNHQCLRQDLPFCGREAELGKEFCFARSFRVVEPKQVIDDLAPIDTPIGCVWKLHGRAYWHFQASRRAGKNAERFAITGSAPMAPDMNLNVVAMV